MRKNKGQVTIQHVTVILVIVALAGSWMAYSSAGPASTEGLAEKEDVSGLEDRIATLEERISTLEEGQTSIMEKIGVTPPPQISVMSVSAPPVKAGEEATITVSVINTGGESGTKDITLKVAGESVDTQTVTVPAGEAKTVSFSEKKEKSGDYTVSANGSTTTWSVSAEQETYRVAFSPNNLASPYWRTCLTAARQAVRDINDHYGRTVLEIDWAEYNDDASKQADHISSIIGAKGKYDFYSAPAVVEEATVQPLRNLNEAGIPVILWDRDTAPEGREYREFCTITNNVEVGRVQVETLMKALEASDKSAPYKIVAAWGHPGASSAEDRKEGAVMKLNQLEDEGKVEVVASQYHEAWSRSTALDFVSTILGREEVDAVVASNDDMALGALQAAKDAGLTPNEDIYIVGCDAISEAQAAIANGEMLATIAQANYAMAYWSILAGFQHVVYDWEAPQDIIPAPVTAVTPQNVEGFTLERPLIDAWSQYGDTVEELPEEL